MTRANNNDWVEVYSTSTDYEAYLIKGRLESEGIEARILSQVDTTRQFTLGNLAIVRIYVRNSDLATAKQIIDEVDRGE